jgi:hypothetical protein
MDGVTSPGSAFRPPQPTERVDEICDRFETAWRGGQVPRIEDYLAEAEDADRAAILGELVAVERELRRRRGEHPRTEEYVDRFPAHAAVVHAAFIDAVTEGIGTNAEPFTGTERFALIREIGAGGMGIVFEAEDRERLSRIALKTLHLVSPTHLYRFKKEFRCLQSLVHPNLVTLYEFIAEKGHWFLTMELVAGEDLLTYVRGYVDAHEAESEKDAFRVKATDMLVSDSTLGGNSSTCVAVGEGLPTSSKLVSADVTSEDAFKTAFDTPLGGGFAVSSFVIGFRPTGA